MNQFPLYAKSTHADVVAAIEARDASHQDLKDRALAFAAEHGCTTSFSYRPCHDGSVKVVALHTEDGTKPPGRWKKARHGGWQPSANHPAAAQFDTLQTAALKVPGYPTQIWQTSSLHGTRIGGPKFILHDGVVHAKIPFRSDDTDNVDMLAEHEAAGWAEILESEWTNTEQVTHGNPAEAAA